MRADKQYPRQVYADFVDWLRWHPAWTIGLLFGYLYYLATTEETRSGLTISFFLTLRLKTFAGILAHELPALSAWAR